MAGQRQQTIGELQAMALFPLSFAIPAGSIIPVGPSSSGGSRWVVNLGSFPVDIVVERIYVGWSQAADNGIGTLARLVHTAKTDIDTYDNATILSDEFDLGLGLLGHVEATLVLESAALGPSRKPTANVIDAGRVLGLTIDVDPDGVEGLYVTVLATTIRR